MKKVVCKLGSWALIIPYIISILGWNFGWDLTYRPIPNAPVISPYTSFIFIILFFYKVTLPTLNLTPPTVNYFKLGLLALITSVLFLELAVHSSGSSEFLGHPLSAVSTILTFFLICVYEILSNEIDDNFLLADAILFLSAFWVYLSICGHIFGEIVLTGISDNPLIGLSLPTALSFTLYIAIAVSSDKVTFTKKLYLAVPWTKKYIFLYTAGFLLLPALFITLLKNVSIAAKDHFTIFISFSLIGLFFISLFIVLVHFLSRTHIGLQMICTYTKRIKGADGKWIPIESYLQTNYGLDLKPGSSPDGQKALSKQLKRD